MRNSQKNWLFYMVGRKPCTALIWRAGAATQGEKVEALRVLGAGNSLGKSPVISKSMDLTHLESLGLSLAQANIPSKGKMMDLEQFWSPCTVGVYSYLK